MLRKILLVCGILSSRRLAADRVGRFPVVGWRIRDRSLALGRDSCRQHAHAGRVNRKGVRDETSRKHAAVSHGYR